MERVDEYRRRAEETRKLAEKAPPGFEREGLQKMAEQWLKLADQVSARRHP
jgi:hypothetical protein